MWSFEDLFFSTLKMLKAHSPTTPRHPRQNPVKVEGSYGQHDYQTRSLSKGYPTGKVVEAIFDDSTSTVFAREEQGAAAATRGSTSACARPWYHSSHSGGIHRWFPLVDVVQIPTKTPITD